MVRNVEVIVKGLLLIGCGIIAAWVSTCGHSQLEQLENIQYRRLVLYKEHRVSIIFMR